MRVTLTHKIALDPNNAQETYFRKGCGVARFAYNWALSQWNEERQSVVSGAILTPPSEVGLRRKLNSIKHEAYPWMVEVGKCAVQEAIVDLGMAFRAFFDKRSGYPQFKKKGKRDSFCASNQAGKFVIEERRIRLPKVGWIRMREPLRFSGRAMRVTVMNEAGRWFASILVDCEVANSTAKGGAIGIDLGISRLATLSNGEIVDAPKPLRALIGSVRRLHKSLSRKVYGSQNASKATKRLAKLHARITNIRKDVIHKATSSITKRFDVICVEDLNVKGMVKNRRLARSIVDSSFREFRRQIEYKAALNGGTVVVADRWFPSSKACSECGCLKQDLKLKDRIFACTDCGTSLDRDLNAAINLEKLAASSAVSACGVERSGVAIRSRVKRSTAKQEPNNCFGERGEPVMEGAE